MSHPVREDKRVTRRQQPIGRDEGREKGEQGTALLRPLLLSSWSIRSGLIAEAGEREVRIPCSILWLPRSLGKMMMLLISLPH